MEKIPHAMDNQIFFNVVSASDGISPKLPAFLVFCFGIGPKPNQLYNDKGESKYLTVVKSCSAKKRAISICWILANIHNGSISWFCEFHPTKKEYRI